MCACVCVCACMRIFVCACMYMCMCARVCVYVLYVYVGVYVCLFVYVSAFVRVVYMFMSSTDCNFAAGIKQLIKMPGEREIYHFIEKRLYFQIIRELTTHEMAVEGLSYKMIISHVAHSTGEGGGSAWRQPRGIQPQKLTCKSQAKPTICD